MNKKAQLNPEETFKAVITVIIGFIFLDAFREIVDPGIIQTFTDIGILLIVLGGLMILLQILRPWIKF